MIATRRRLRGICQLLFALAVGACNRSSCEQQTDAPAQAAAAPRKPARFRCGSEPAPVPSSERQTRMLSAVEHAISYFEGSSDPHALLMLDVMRRRFGIASFDDALARYDQMMGLLPHDPILRILRRIADHDNALQPADQAAALTAQVDQLTVPALYCDRTPLPASYAAMLRAANEAGGYQRTHALLALQWLRDNGCESPATTEYENALVRAVAQLVVVDGGITDLELEAAALLSAYGRADALDGAFVDEAVAAQNEDGGWLIGTGETPGSDWHATTLGLYFLLHAYCGPRSYPPMLEGVPPTE